MMLLFFGPLILLSSGLVIDIWLIFLLYIVSGLGMSGIGMCVMHDAIHGSYSRFPIVNKLLGLSFNLIGANATVWKIQHNVLHHTFTNIDAADDDLNMPSFLRFSPHAKHYWIHRFQHWYVWLIYGVSTVFWVTAKDFVRFNRYRKLGLLGQEKQHKYILGQIIAWKVFYFSYALILPLIMIPQASWIIILAFLSMHFITGLMISSVFQIAHIMPNTEFPLPDKNGMVAGDWHSHQLATTSNFSPGSRLFSWLIGGLNYQVEHHLLPHICHIHYRELSGIVATTAHEFEIPYNTKKTFIGALRDHFNMLRDLGQNQGASIRSAAA
ncbi:MAG: fatty acid desaturase family protein [Flavobacteriaceae bacterium]